ncbi:MAG: c-type cytochrome, partial [Betaproteobacteria bacterium]
SKLVLGKRDDHIAIMLNGKPGTAMASFKGLSDTELAAVITYSRNAWGNKAEDNLVQPLAVKDARK